MGSTICHCETMLLLLSLLSASHAAPLAPWSAYGEVCFGGFMNSGVINVEYRPSSRVSVSVGGGRAKVDFAEAGGHYRGARVQGHLLLGKNGHHFELAPGGGPVLGEAGPADESRKVREIFFPSGQIGYRYQKPDGGLIVRLGAGSTFATAGAMLSGGWAF
ncbi:MAG: hypothetical protein AAFV53_40760 [Myxococcota bacterium]